MKKILAIMAVALLASHAHAAPKKSFSAEDRAAVERVENYLTSVTTIVADFTQIAPDGNLATGKFFLSRPGKMRWQYDPPTPILMVADGNFLVFYDYELDQTSHIPLQETLPGFLARPVVKFGEDVVVTDVVQGAGSLRVTVIQSDKPNDGSLTLEFADNPLQLRNMKVLDATGQETTVSLANARFGQKLDASLFVFEDNKTKPRIGKQSGGGIQR